MSQINLQGSAKRLWPGLVNFAVAVAYHFCLSLPTAFTQHGKAFWPSPVHTWNARISVGRLSNIFILMLNSTYFIYQQYLEIYPFQIIHLYQNRHRSASKILWKWEFSYLSCNGPVYTGLELVTCFTQCLQIVVNNNKPEKGTGRRHSYDKVMTFLEWQRF